MNKNKSFTLIELLVVIAIIGLLATIVMISVGSAREKAMDARRKTDLQAIQQALEMYYIDNGSYPNATAADCWCAAGQSWIPNCNNSALQPYLSRQPRDPVDQCCWPWGNNPCGAGDATYEYASNGKYYLISARLKNRNDPQRAELTGVKDYRFADYYYNTAENFDFISDYDKYCFVLTNYGK